MSNSNFLGRGWTFPPTFTNSNGTVKLVAEEDDIVQSLKIILTTRPGERLTNPEFGCKMFDYLFDPINIQTEKNIVDAIQRAIVEFEPRITVENIVLDTEQELEGIVSIDLTYVIRKINTRSNIVFPFYKLEGTLVDEV